MLPLVFFFSFFLYLFSEGSSTNYVTLNTSLFDPSHSAFSCTVKPRNNEVVGTVKSTVRYNRIRYNHFFFVRARTCGYHTV